MAATAASTIYLRLKKRIHIKPGGTVRLSDAARLLTEPELQEKLENIELYRHRQQDGNRFVIDMLHIVKAIRCAAPHVLIEPYGDPQVLVIIASSPLKPRIYMLLFAWLLLFFGAGLAIMNFHADVSMREVHIRLSELVTGKRQEHPLWFQIPYSFGIGLGMILFFNHLFRKRFNDEPNPLEVELYMYQENVNTYVIAEEMRKKNEGESGGGGDG